MTSQGVSHPKLNGYQQIIKWCAQGAKGFWVFVQSGSVGTRGRGRLKAGNVTHQQHSY